MTIRPYGAWQFTHPDFDTQEAAPGLVLTHAGRIALVDGLASVRQSLLLLLSTVPGERVMRPDYGCNLHLLVFSPNDETTHGLAIHCVREAVSRWEPRAEIVDMDATRSAEAPERIALQLHYRLRQTLQNDVLDMSFDLQPPSR